MIKEFFGIGGFDRTPEGYMSWQHLTFVTSLMVIMVLCAVWLGLKNRKESDKTKNNVLIFSAFLINIIELTKTIYYCIDAGSLSAIRSNLPLFLCSIQLIAIPLAAFAKGRLKESALDFVFIFGWLGAVLGTYAAGQNYGSYPVISFINVNSGLTHAISGFCSLYIVISGMASMKKKNIWITITTLTCFVIAAYTVNCINAPDYQHNYMFLTAGDGTPYDIIYNLVKGNAVLYPIGVALLFFVYIAIFYLCYSMFSKKTKNNKTEANETIHV